MDLAVTCLAICHTKIIDNTAIISVWISLGEDTSKISASRTNSPSSSKV